MTPLQGVWSVVEGGQGWDVTLWKGLGREREWEGLGGVWRPENPRLLVSVVGVHAPSRLWGEEEEVGSQEDRRSRRAVCAEEGGEAWVNGEWDAGAARKGWGGEWRQLQASREKSIGLYTRKYGRWTP